MRVLLTGAFGNIGTSTLKELVRQGHRVRCLDVPARRNRRRAERVREHVEVVWGDVRDAAQMQAVVVDQDAIVHLAYILPPESTEHPQVARDTNVLGTQHLVAAAMQLDRPPKFLFASSFDVFGHTQHLAPPRRITDPVYPTDEYTRHKLLCEELITHSGLPWLIVRFADVPPLALRKAHPIMFSIPLDTRIELLHTHDAGLAIANALTREEVWGRVMLAGGGPRCQVYYRDYLRAMLEAMGVGMLPEDAFGTSPYCTDWLDTTESERLLHYQRHSFEEIIQDIAGVIGIRRYVVPLVRPLVRRSILRLSRG